jgi:hypothetical protein
MLGTQQAPRDYYLESRLHSLAWWALRSLSRNGGVPEIARVVIPSAVACTSCGARGYDRYEIREHKLACAECVLECIRCGKACDGMDVAPNGGSVCGDCQSQQTTFSVYKHISPEYLCRRRGPPGGRTDFSSCRTDAGTSEWEDLFGRINSVEIKWIKAVGKVMTIHVNGGAESLEWHIPISSLVQIVGLSIACSGDWRLSGLPKRFRRIQVRSSDVEYMLHNYIVDARHLYAVIRYIADPINEFARGMDAGGYL